MIETFSILHLFRKKNTLSDILFYLFWPNTAMFLRIDILSSIIAP